MIRFETILDKVSRSRPDADLDGWKGGLGLAGVDWANAFTGGSVSRSMPLGSFAIKDEFFARLNHRARAEVETLGQGIVPAAYATAHVGAISLKCFDFVRWEREAYNRLADSLQEAAGAPQGRFLPQGGRRVLGSGRLGTQGEKPPGRADASEDLVVRFVDRFTVTPSEDAVAVFVNTAGHRGSIEILAKPGWVFLAAGQTEPAGAAKAFAFRRVILHELGHYFGLTHLPQPQEGQGFLEPSAMCPTYSKTSAALTPADAAKANAIEYLSLDVRGRICAGLRSE